MGGVISLCYTLLYPQSVARLVSISSAYKAYPVNIAYRTIQQNIIRQDPKWNNGYYTEQPYDGLLLARKLGILAYRNTAELNARFNNPENKATNLQSYLDYNAKKFVDSFDANSYIYLTQAMEHFDAKNLFPTENPFARINAKTLIVSVTSDVLFVPSQQTELYQEITAAGVNTEYVNYEANFGHDTFLIETEKMGQYIKTFLE